MGSTPPTPRPHRLLRGLPGYLIRFAPHAFAPQRQGRASGPKTDAQVRKRGEQTGLDTLVVHAVNDVDLEVVPLRRGFRS